MTRHFLWLILALMAALPARADVAPADFGTVTVCEGLPAGTVPTFEEAACRTVPGWQASPHHRMLWVRTTIDLPANMLASGTPLALYVSGKAAGRFYIGGNLVGENGVPGPDATHETPGRMDVAFPLEKAALKPGLNDFVLLLSGQHSHLDLVAPLHFIGIAPYTDPTARILKAYLPSLLPFGVLVAGALYFGILAVVRRARGRLLLVPMVALFAAGQLLAEVSRGLVAYEYPFHDIRLVLILVCALAAGACLLLHVLDRFVPRHRLLVGLAAFLAAWEPVVTAHGFDGKSFFALAAPAGVGALVALAAAVRREAKAGRYALVLAVFTIAAWQVQEAFLDIYYYYVVAALMLFLFAEQVRLHMEDRRIRAAERARADRLQQILDERAERHAPGSIRVTGAGKVDLVPTDQLQYCKGARDYVELVLADGTSHLHGGSMADLEADLPGTFLRVHRSYIVNTGFIQSLERDSGGSGILRLTTGTDVPVSRRIMPAVRKALV
ncbi:MAG: LytTR family transcriptional regulator [Alphaproteobacteria bacterium]|nr:MAG: LytTR family transcriptional regulator [Alphaproteobacteria bacterium]